MSELTERYSHTLDSRQIQICILSVRAPTLKVAPLPLLAAVFFFDGISPWAFAGDGFE